jgi:hypothetical protein
MLDRRTLVKLGFATVATAWVPRLWAFGDNPDTSKDRPIRLVFIHGRGQEGRNAERLKSEWIATLRRGTATLGRELPEGLEVSLPFYGDKLDEFARQMEIPLTSDIQTRGSPVNNEFLAFQAEVAEVMRQRAGVTDAQVDAEYGPNPKPKGPQNWEWVQATLRALDKYGGGMSQSALENFMRDVFLYTFHPGVRDEIDGVVALALTEEPAVVVSHSLGSVVAYSVLSTDRRSLNVPLYVTLGSPLALRAIRNQFRPLRFPKPVTTWYNAFDERDIVALYPLDGNNFPIRPPIANYSSVRNHTKNRHGIVGYLDDPKVAQRILDAIEG